MKLSVYSILFAGLLILSCGSNSSTQPEDTDQQVVATAKESLIEHLNATTFKQKVFDYENPTSFKYNGSIPCIVDFYATWCGPCRKMAPILDELAVTYKGKINIYKVDTDKEQNLAGVMGIRGIPALFFFPTKGEPFRLEGYTTKQDMIMAIEDLLKRSAGEAVKK